VLDAAGSGVHTRRRIRMPENRRLERGKAHVARRHELDARAARATLDLCDAHEPARTQVSKEKADGRFARQPCCLLAECRRRRRVHFVTPVLWRLTELHRGWVCSADYCRSKTDRVLTLVQSGLLIT